MSAQPAYNYLEGGDAAQQSIKNASFDVRSGFIRKVYGILTAQLILTVAVAAPFQSMSVQTLQQNIWMLYVSLGMTVVTICAMSCKPDIARVFPQNYIFLFTFTAFEGVAIGFVSAMYTWQSVLLAAGVTTLIFVCMTVYACTTKTDFTGSGPYLMAALFGMLIFGCVATVMSSCGANIDGMMMVYDCCGVILFTFYIVYDTQLIMGAHGGHKKHEFGIDDYVFAALNLYLDIINLFLYILSLLGEKK